MTGKPHNKYKKKFQDKKIDTIDDDVLFDIKKYLRRECHIQNSRIKIKHTIQFGKRIKILRRLPNIEISSIAKKYAIRTPDIIILDENNHIKTIIEQDGQSHELSSVKKRDQIRNKQYTSANIPYIVINTKKLKSAKKAWYVYLNEEMKKLDAAFGEKSLFSETIKNHFGKDGKVIKDVFDPNREGSPLYFLKKEFSNNIHEIKEKLGIDKAIEEEENKGTRKGSEFEDQCEEKLRWIANIHTDKLERTSNG